MCGVVGWIALDGHHSGSADFVLKATRALSHRGPDDEGFYSDEYGELGHRRLSVIDLSPQARQPMRNEAGSLWLVYNGEIYNYRHLRETLKVCGHHFRTETDSEVIIHAYEEWGEECLQHFNGMFALAIWDKVNKKLFAARDRIGIKPFFYSCTGNQLGFASELQSLKIFPFIRSDLDYQSLIDFLSFNYSIAPRTLLKGIRQLLPGHYLIFDQKGLQIKAYWNLAYLPKWRKSEKELLGQLDLLFSESVSLRLQADVPLGAFLSGGLDSSLVTSYMVRLHGRSIKTFSVGFADKSYDELQYARQVARYLGTEHHEMVLDEEDLVNIIPELVGHMAEPTADSSALAVYCLSRFAREQVTVALAGDGADEVMAGYETYTATLLAKYCRYLPGIFRKSLEKAADLLPVNLNKVSLDSKAKRFIKGCGFTPLQAHFTWRLICESQLRRSLLRNEVWEEVGDYDPLHRFADMNSSCLRYDTLLDKILDTDLKVYLPNDMLVKVDRMSMAHALEVRVPFLDHELVEFFARLPIKMKLSFGLKRKYLLKKLAMDKLPHAIIHRSKAGFNIPVGKWIHGRLRGYFSEKLSEKNIGLTEILNPKIIRMILDDHWQGKADYSHELWGVLFLTEWLNQNK